MVGLTGEWLGETCAGVSAPWRDRSSWLTWCVCRWAMFPWVHWQLCSWPGGVKLNKRWNKKKKIQQCAKTTHTNILKSLINYSAERTGVANSLVCRVVCPSWSCGHVSQPWSAPASWPPLQPPVQCSQLPVEQRQSRWAPTSLRSGVMAKCTWRVKSSFHLLITIQHHPMVKRDKWMIIVSHSCFNMCPLSRLSYTGCDVTVESQTPHQSTAHFFGWKTEITWLPRLFASFTVLISMFCCKPLFLNTPFGYFAFFVTC